MEIFDSYDPERRGPSTPTPRCGLCHEAASPRYGNLCFRHATYAPVRELYEVKSPA